MPFNDVTNCSGSVGKCGGWKFKATSGSWKNARDLPGFDVVAQTDHFARLVYKNCVDGIGHANHMNRIARREKQPVATFYAIGKEQT